MARLRLRVVAQDTSGNARAGATIRLFQPGTGNAIGALLTGTPFAGALFAAPAGGGALGVTTFEADSNGQVIVYTETPSRVDVGILHAGVAGVTPHEEFQYDPASISAIELELTGFPDGTSLLPGIAFRDQPSVGMGRDSSHRPYIVANNVRLWEVEATATTLRSPNGTRVMSIRNDNQLYSPGGSTGGPWYSFADSGTAGLGASAGAGGYPFLARNGVKLWEAEEASTALRSPNGLYIARLDNTGVFTAPRALERFGIFNPLDHGIVAGVNVGNTIRQANSDALAGLVAGNVGITGSDARMSAGGIINFPAGQFEFNTTVFSNGVAAARTIGLQGVRYATILKFWGTTGYLIDWATPTNPWRNCFMRDLVIDCGQAMTAGALIRLKSNIYDFTMDDVWIRPDAATAGPWTAIQVGDSTVTVGQPSLVSFTRVKTGLVAPSTGSALHLYTANGIYAHQCDFTGYAYSGQVARTTGIRCSPNGTAIGSVLDTVMLTSCLVKDHRYGIRLGESGGTHNFQMLGGHIDGIGAHDGATGAPDGYGVFVLMAASAQVNAIQFDAPWIANYGNPDSYGFYLDSTAAGCSINDFNVGGAGKITQCRRSAIYSVGDSARTTNLVFNGVMVMDLSADGQNAIEITAADGLMMSGNSVFGTITAGYCAVIGTGVLNCVVVGNQGSRKTTGRWALSGAATATRIFANNTA